MKHAAASKEDVKAAINEVAKEFEEAAKGNKDLISFTNDEVVGAAEEVKQVMKDNDKDVVPDAVQVA